MPTVSMMAHCGTALVVEDHPGVMALVVLLLENGGWSTLQAKTPAQASELLAGAPVDVVVSDVTLPGGDGEVPTYPRDARGHAPGVVYMSGDTARAAIRRQPGTEQSLFLRKPFAPSALLSAVAAAKS